jgi:hypothetical protein
MVSIQTRAQGVHMGYQYTGQDVENILQTSFEKEPLKADYARYFLDENNDLVQVPQEDHDLYSVVTFRINNRFITPSAEQARGFHLCDYLREHLVRIVKIEGAPAEIIIPYNPGGHWVTIRILIQEGKIDMTYVDSLRGSGNMCILEALKPIIAERFSHPVNMQCVRARIQNDGSSCGILTTQNIMDIARNLTLPVEQSMSHEDVMSIRFNHGGLLHEHGLSLDTKHY